MNPFSFGCILIGVLLNAGAQLCLKAGVSHIGSISFSIAQSPQILFKMISQPFILLGLGCYAISVVVWVMALSRVDVSIAYPILSLGYVVNAISAYYLFNEAFSTQKIIGIAVILLGVIILSKS